MQREDILHLASLARIELSAEEIDRFPGEIEEILEFVGQVQELSAGDEVVRDMRNSNTFREDAAQASDSRDAIVEGFPQSEDEYLKVPKILNN